MTLNQSPPQKSTDDQSSLHWHALGAEEVLKHLDTYAEHGLTEEEASQRFEVYDALAGSQAQDRLSASCPV